MGRRREKAPKRVENNLSIRWLVLILLAMGTFFCFVFGDILSPVKSLLETAKGWDSRAFGTYAGALSFVNVFFFFLIFAGIILDKMGARFTLIIAGMILITGAVINWYAVTEAFIRSELAVWFNHHLNYIPVFDELGVSPFYRGMPASAKLASIGFMIFGCGSEIVGIAVARGITKWFKGKELALALSLNMAIGRLGLATCMIFSPLIANISILGSADVSNSAAFGAMLLMITVVLFIAFYVVDKKSSALFVEAEEKGDPFKLGDIGRILSNRNFWLVALLCVFYYSAIVPFQKYAVNVLECNLNFMPLPTDSFWASGTVITGQYFLMIAAAAAAFSSNFFQKKVKTLLFIISLCFIAVLCFLTFKQQSAGAVFSIYPLLAVCITPALGNYIDRKGKAVTLLIFGSGLLIVCHLAFAFILPLFRGSEVGGFLLSYVVILLLGASFSLVPASLWSSVPKLVDKKVFGTTYALIFWIQNIGVWLFPILIGRILIASNTGVAEQLALGLITPDEAAVMYNYTNPLILLACLGVVSLLLSIVLKITDRKKCLGLELPNIKQA